MTNDLKTIIKWSTEQLNYEFKDYNLLRKALTHPSFNNGAKDGNNYEKLEFIGDAVLNLIITDLLNATYPNDNEGELARKRAVLVCTEQISHIALNVKLDQMMIMSGSEINNNGGKNKNNLENCLEAITGAIYCDSNYETAKTICARLWKNYINDIKEAPVDPKTKLQEWAQKKGYDLPKYEVLKTEGEAHQPIFTIKVEVNGKIAIITASSKKEGKRKAAHKLLKIIGI